MSGKYAKRIERGIALLDADVPDWRNRVDCETLDLSDCAECVLGHVYGDYALGLGALRIDNTTAVDAGFEVEYRVNSYTWLGKAWRKVLNCD